MTALTKHYAETPHLNSRSTGFLLEVVFTNLWFCMTRSSWVLLALASKHREVSLRQLDIDRSTWVLVVISYPRVAAWLGSAVVHWKRKNIDKRRGRECGLYDGVWSSVVLYSLTELKNCWSLCQSFRLYLGVHRQRTSGKWTHRTRGSLGWYPRRSQTCKDDFQSCFQYNILEKGEEFGKLLDP